MESIGASPRQAAGDVLPKTAVLRCTLRMKIDFQFARYRGSNSAITGNAMSFVTFVSGRYLRTRQKRAFISLITVLSISGVTVGVMALIVVIAVMAGFENDLKSRIMGIRPHLVLNKKQGVFSDYKQILTRMKPIEEIQTASAFITTQVVLRTTTRAAGAILKAIEAAQGKISIDSVDTSRLLTRALAKEASGGKHRLPGIILGKELAASLGVIRGDTVYMISPRGMLSPVGHIPAMIKFEVADLFESGMYEFDGTLAFVDLKQAQKILRMPTSVSGIEIRLQDMDRVKAVSKAIERVVGSGYAIENWKQMNRNLFSALRLEKTVMFIILALIVLVAAFNIAGSLVMMVMEKRKDIAILKAMGATARSIGRIFVIKGLMIGLVGTVLGTSAGLMVCTLLKRYSFIQLPADIYYINTLPVNLKISDVLLIALCALIICFAATLYPARQAAGIDPVEAIRHG
ncbi:lipoprotein-releasing ABC transporter permease subunit [Desulfosarcina sp.]|uniref:lipoprotein-releasing ABC transporter permease subunit n=1 Tax=Desulfosarcina sp. TaxID=2027861 RepID=UPI0029B7E7BF|nr:lipoprotein-releasing ABC transporter permease subunit [Desulfosarcina sp.]MDX2452249.1 lipoprotein-releasing ABC transporter permease subunit [Desulfosarcina sp.]MDX2490029.1 lipoprotein-releasing ABC transporter permease subunit [Desulfosarcina sp.]